MPHQRVSNTEFILTTLGFLSLLWWCFDLVLKTITMPGHAHEVLWLCSLVLIPLGYGLLRRKSEYLIAVLAIAITIHIPWTVDFLFTLFHGYSIGGMADYIFDLSFIQYIDTVRHLFILPVAYAGVLLVKKFSSKSYVVSLGLFWSTIAISRLLPPSFNLNCSYETCLLPWRSRDLSVLLTHLVAASVVIVIVVFALRKILPRVKESYQWILLHILLGVGGGLAIFGWIILFVFN